MSTLRHSRQRDEIRACLKGRKDHPTAEMVYETLRETDPSLSLGTVYRNLTLLTRLGEAKEIGTEDGPDRFDGDVSLHSHFICRKCHSMTDIWLNDMESLISHAEEKCGSDTLIQDLSANFYGICGECRKKEAAALTENLPEAE